MLQHLDLACGGLLDFYNILETGSYVTRGHSLGGVSSIRFRSQSAYVFQRASKPRIRRVRRKRHNC
jgi:hypothetical protein